MTAAREPGAWRDLSTHRGRKGEGGKEEEEDGREEREGGKGRGMRGSEEGGEMCVREELNIIWFGDQLSKIKRSSKGKIGTLRIFLLFFSLSFWEEVRGTKIRDVEVDGSCSG